MRALRKNPSRLRSHYDGNLNEKKQLVNPGQSKRKRPKLNKPFCNQRSLYMSNILRFLTQIICVILFFFAPAAESGQDRDSIVVVFRFDDYSSLSSTDLEIKLLGAFSRYNFSCTFGVIPYVCAGDWHNTSPQEFIPLTPYKAKILSNAIEAGTLEVALHGCTHQTIRNKEHGGLTEFLGLDYESQNRKIKTGKKLLDEMLDTHVTTFIPPGNSYDLNTIRALEHLGFNCISGNRYGSAIESSELDFLPVTCGILELPTAIESARHIREVQPIIIAGFHGFDFLDINKDKGLLTYEEFTKILGWISLQQDVTVLSIEETTALIDDLGGYRFVRNRSYCRGFSLMPSLLIKPANVYFSPPTADHMKARVLAITFLFYSAIFLISYFTALFVSSILFPRFRSLTPILCYGGPILLFLSSIYALSDLVLGHKGAIAIVILLAANTGAWTSFLKTKKHSR